MSTLTSTLNLTGAIPGSSVVWLALTLAPYQLGANRLVNAGTISIFISDQVRLSALLLRRHSLAWKSLLRHPRLLWHTWDDVRARFSNMMTS